MKMNSKWLAILQSVSVLWFACAVDAQCDPMSPYRNGAFCGACDAPQTPPAGVEALRLSHDDAYVAVSHLLPAAEAGDLQSEISIAFIMQDRLAGHLSGKSKEPFTWRECYTWWTITAYKSAGMAALLGGLYWGGLYGLPKNEKLGTCLEIGDSRPVHDRVAECFKQFGNQ